MDEEIEVSVLLTRLLKAYLPVDNVFLGEQVSAVEKLVEPFESLNDLAFPTDKSNFERAYQPVGDLLVLVAQHVQQRALRPAAVDENRVHVRRVRNSEQLQEVLVLANLRRVRFFECPAKIS